MKKRPTSVVGRFSSMAAFARTANKRLGCPGGGKSGQTGFRNDEFDQGSQQRLLRRREEEEFVVRPITRGSRPGAQDGSMHRMERQRASECSDYL